MNEELRPSRRHFLKLLTGATALGGMLTALPRRALAALPHLTQKNSQTAKALRYVENDAKAGPPHKAGEKCLNCVHYHGKPGEVYGPCDLFPGFSVHKNGWCAGYAVKPKAR